MPFKLFIKFLLPYLSGIACAYGALYIEIFFSLNSDYENRDYYLVFFNNYFLVSLIEELSKFVMLFLFFKFNKPRKPLLYIALLIGLGFSTFEMVNYIYYQHYEPRLWIPFMLHLFLASIEMRIMMYAKTNRINKYFYMNLAWIFAWLTHGFYDLSATLSVNWGWQGILSILGITSIYILISKTKPNRPSSDHSENESNDFGFFR